MSLCLLCAAVYSARCSVLAAAVGCCVQLSSIYSLCVSAVVFSQTESSILYCVQLSSNLCSAQLVILCCFCWVQTSIISHLISFSGRLDAPPSLRSEDASTMRGQRNALLWASAIAVGVTAVALIAYSLSQNRKSIESSKPSKAAKFVTEETDALDQGMHGMVWNKTVFE